MLIGFLVVGAPVAAQTSEATWQYTGCDGHWRRPNLSFVPVYGLEGDDINVMLAESIEFVAVSPQVSPTFPYILPHYERIDGTITLEFERSLLLGEEEMRWILDVLGRDPEAVSEPVQNPVVLDISGYANIIGGPSMEMKSREGRVDIYGANPLPREGLVEFYGIYDVVAAKIEFDIPYGRTCVIEGFASEGDPVARFSVSPSGDEENKIENARAAEADVEAAKKNRITVLAITAAAALGVLIHVTKNIVVNRRKDRAVEPDGEL